MTAPARHFHIRRAPGSIKAAKLEPQPLLVLWLDTRLRSLAEESLKPSVPERLDHGRLYLYEIQWSSLPPSIAQRAFDKLRLLHAASNLDDLRVPPSNRLEKLKRDRRGQWSIRINDQWRICFNFEAGNAHNVEVVDYR